MSAERVQVRVDARSNELAETILPFEDAEYYDLMRRRWTDAWVKCVQVLIVFEDLNFSVGRELAEDACAEAEEMLVHINRYAEVNRRGSASYRLRELALRAGAA